MPKGSKKKEKKAKSDKNLELSLIKLIEGSLVGLKSYSIQQGIAILVKEKFQPALEELNREFDKVKKAKKTIVEKATDPEKQQSLPSETYLKKDATFQKFLIVHERLKRVLYPVIEELSKLYNDFFDKRQDEYLLAVDLLGIPASTVFNMQNTLLNPTVKNAQQEAQRGLALLGTVEAWVEENLLINQDPEGNLKEGPQAVLASISNHNADRKILADRQREEKARSEQRSQAESQAQQCSEALLKAAALANDAARAEVTVEATITTRTETAQESKEKKESQELVKLLRQDLTGKLEKLEEQTRCFTSATLAQRKTSFVTVFKIGSLPDQSVIRPEHYSFLGTLFELNTQYYTEILKILKRVDLTETRGLLDALTAIRKLNASRFDKATDVLKPFGITNTSLLTNLLVPVYRAVFKFEKQNLWPLAKEVVLKECRVLKGRLEATKVKLGTVQTSAEGDGVKMPKVAVVTGYQRKLDDILQEENDPYRLVDKLLALQQQTDEAVFKPCNAFFSERDNLALSLSQSLAAERGGEEVKEAEETFEVERFLTENLPFLKQANAIDILERLFSSQSTVTFQEFSNMLQILRKEAPSSAPVQNHSFFKFPALWKDQVAKEQVLISIPHREGMSAQAEILDPNTIAQLKKACRATGLEPSLLKKVLAHHQQSAKKSSLLCE